MGQRTPKEQWLHDLEMEEEGPFDSWIARTLEERHPDLYQSLKAELLESAWQRKLEVDAKIEAYHQSQETARR